MSIKDRIIYIYNNNIKTMGASVSTNVVKNCISSQVSIVNSTSNGIYTSLGNNVSLTICASDGSNVTIDGDIDISQFAQFNGTATLSAMSSASVQQAMTQQAAQQAEAISQQFALGTVAAASNVSEMTSNLCTAIQNSITQVINTNINNIAAVTVCATGNSTLKYTGAINISQGLSVFTKYVIDSTMTSDAAISLQQLVDQSAKSKMENFLSVFGAIGAVIVIIVIIVIVIFVGGKSKNSNNNNNSS